MENIFADIQEPLTTILAESQQEAEVIGIALDAAVAFGMIQGNAFPALNVQAVKTKYADKIARLAGIAKSGSLKTL